MTGPVLSRAERELLERFRFPAIVHSAFLDGVAAGLARRSLLSARPQGNRAMVRVETTAAGRALLDGGLG